MLPVCSCEHCRSEIWEAPVFQRDWLMRQIEMIGRMLAAILGKARSGQPLEALGMFDAAYQPLLGVGSKLLPLLSDEQLVDMLKPGGVPDPHRWPLLVQLLKTEADLYAELDEHDESLPRYRKALMLLRTFGGERLPDPELAADLAGRLRAYELNAATRIDVAWLYERSGCYADAEDTLYEAIEGEEGDEQLVDAGIGFYRRLLARDDGDLAAGDLPRAEVQAGLAELLARPPAV
jgi:tetratricopeptide (TPR) repeat protein